MEQKNRPFFLLFKLRFLSIILASLFISGINAQPHSLPAVLEVLSQQYQVFFSYDADLLAKEQVNFIVDKNETAESAIQRLLSRVGLNYDRFEDKYYVIYQKGYEKPTALPIVTSKKSTAHKKKKIKKILSSLLLDDKTELPISDAFIFIRNTSIGTTSDLLGYFSLEIGDFKRGELVITHLNYQTKTFRLTDLENLAGIVRLSPKNLAFAEVKVKAKRLKSKKRKQWMKQFTKALFGEGSNRRGMKILNPEVVWFQEKDGELLAEAVDYLSIYNPSLGYQLRFYLEAFRTDAENKTDYIGTVFFEDKKNPLATKKQGNTSKIERRRNKTYRRSKKYFFRSLLAGALDTEQFPFGEAILDDNSQVLYFDPLTLDSLNIKRGQFQDTLLTNNFFAFSNQKIIASWSRSSALNNYATCFLFAENGQIILDHSGEIVNPKEIIEIGYWTGQRLADLMPMEYNYVRPIIEEKAAEDLVSSLANKVNELPQEKVYLHLNKPFYSLTESIWFKAYLVNAHNHSTRTLSKVVYIDLIDPTGEITKSWTLHRDKVMDGDFRFNSMHQAGEYQIRAYTQYMRNVAPEFFFQKSFWVYDYSIKKDTITINTTEKRELSEKIWIDFFPEGGELVNDLSNNIAFKVTDLDGNVIDIKGTIVGEEGQVITKLKTQHEGLGLFNLTPKRGTSYQAFVEYNGKVHTFDLPKRQEDGLVMSIHQAPDLRTAIHWAPNVQMGKNQPAKISFYSADTPTIYEIRVEGVTTDGKPIFKTMNLEIGQ